MLLRSSALACRWAAGLPGHTGGTGIGSRMGALACAWREWTEQVPCSAAPVHAELAAEPVWTPSGCTICREPWLYNWWLQGSASSCVQCSAWLPLAAGLHGNMVLPGSGSRAAVQRQHAWHCRWLLITHSACLARRLCVTCVAVSLQRGKYTEPASDPSLTEEYTWMKQYLQRLCTSLLVTFASVADPRPVCRQKPM
jgi:hypothetical protein